MQVQHSGFMRLSWLCYKKGYENKTQIKYLAIVSQGGRGTSLFFIVTKGFQMMEPYVILDEASSADLSM